MNQEAQKKKRSVEICKQIFSMNLDFIIYDKNLSCTRNTLVPIVLNHDSEFRQQAYIFKPCIRTMLICQGFKYKTSIVSGHKENQRAWQLKVEHLL